MAFIILIALVQLADLYVATAYHKEVVDYRPNGFRMIIKILIFWTLFNLSGFVNCI